MTDIDLIIELSIEEVCEIADIPADIIIMIVDEGVIEPVGESQTEWRFDITALNIAKRAVRLHQDLEIEWHSIPFYLEIIRELEKTRFENKRLKQQLNRFLLE